MHALVLYRFFYNLRKYTAGSSSEPPPRIRKRVTIRIIASNWFDSSSRKEFARLLRKKSHSLGRKRKSNQKHRALFEGSKSFTVGVSRHTHRNYSGKLFWCAGIIFFFSYLLHKNAVHYVPLRVVDRNVRILSKIQYVIRSGNTLQ